MALSAEDVVAQFHRMVAGDGSSLSLEGVEGGAARVRYSKGGDAHCESCVLSPDDLAAMLMEAFERHGAGIVKVELV